MITITSAIGSSFGLDEPEPPTPTTYTANDLNQYTETDEPDEGFYYDHDGNLETDGRYTYEWDAENRLIEIVTREDLGAEQNGPDSGDKKLEFKYDFVGRRVEKVYSVYDVPDQTPDAWVVTSTERFVYDGWTLDTPRLAERDPWRASPAAASQGWNVALVLDDNNATLRKYTWGLDLSRTLHDAGGIGGLLTCVETGGSHQGSYWYFYDANGNVGQVIDASDYRIAARYEYDPYGNEVDPDPTPPDPYDDINPFRFSTKWLDTELAGESVNGAIGETGLYYYGHRYYSPRLGRWLNRDPIQETGGIGLYAFVRNAPMNSVDSQGLKKACDPCLKECEKLHDTQYLKCAAIPWYSLKKRAVCFACLKKATEACTLCCTHGADDPKVCGKKHSSFFKKCMKDNK